VGHDAGVERDGVDSVVEVVEEPEGSQFVVRVDGDVAGAAYYRRVGDRVVFTHTEVSDPLQGRGIGSRLARGALDVVRGRGELVVPLCPFIARYISRHPEYADLVDGELLAELAGTRG
jgi:predicted GNAT family acetyltransferase